MELNYFSKDLTRKEEDFFINYLKKKTPAIEKLLERFEDTSILRVTIVKFEKHDAYNVEFSLSLPSKNLIANEDSHTITKATDQAKDRLLGQIKKHLAHLRGDRSHQTIRKASKVAQPLKEDVEISENY